MLRRFMVVFTRPLLVAVVVLAEDLDFLNLPNPLNLLATLGAVVALDLGLLELVGRDLI